MESQNTDKPQISKREAWFRISNSILEAQDKHPTTEYIEQLSATYAKYLNYIDPHKLQFYLLPENQKQLCRLVYLGEVLTDIKERAYLLMSIKNIDPEAFILGFCRFYDVVSHFYGMFIGRESQYITGIVNVFTIKSKINILVQILQNILQMTHQTIMEQCQNMMNKCFQKFKIDLFKRKQQILERQNPGDKSPTRKQSFDTNTLTRLPYQQNKEKLSLCEDMMKNTNLYEHNSQYQILRADAIQFCLIYIIRNLLDDKNLSYFRDHLIQILNILENPTPNNKRYRALDPKSWDEYKERSKIFYTTIYQVINEAIKGPRLNRHESFKQTYKGFYLGYNQHKGFGIKHGELTIVSKKGDYYLLVRNTAPQTPLPKDDIEIIIPGFINLHTHTKYSFQGNVNFGSMFGGRFQWRQAQFQGKYVVELYKVINKQVKTQEQFKKYVKIYTQLQGLIGGTTTIFQQSKFDPKNIYPDIIRNTIPPPEVPYKRSFNITSNDIYIMWRNQKQKNDLMLSWSQDYNNFVKSVIEIELGVLQTFESHRTNLHVHLAEGRSKYAITLCEFDNFCEDIICMQHFLRHLKAVMRDKSLVFEKKFNIQCESKTQNVNGINIVSARSVDGNFSSFMTIRKQIKFSKQNKIDTSIQLQIDYHYRPKQGPKEKKRVALIPHSELVQVYQIHTLRSNLLVIHANGMDPSSQLHQYVIKTYNVCICISPHSNISLYGGVNQFNWKDLLTNPKHQNMMCISTDWSPTGKENLFQQIRFMLKKLKQVNFKIDEKLYHKILQMITVNPARIAKMQVGEIKDNFFADFWIGKFPAARVVQNNHISVDKLIQYILTQFPYQNDIKKIYSKGRLVYSDVQEIGLQPIILSHQKKRYFLNPEGHDNFDFQNYIADIRKLMIQKCKSAISLLFP